MDVDKLGQIYWNKVELFASKGKTTENTGIIIMG
jgi:hypothetical protein